MKPRFVIRWLRPDDHKPSSAQSVVQQKLDIEEDLPVDPAKPKSIAKQPWPKAMRDQIRAVREVMSRIGAPVLPADVAKCFARAPKAAVADVLDMLADVGQVRQTEDGGYVA